MMGYYGWGMGAFGWIGMILFWILIILGIIYLARTLELGKGSGAGRSESSTDSSRDAALEILRERYARGEIDREEYEQRRRDLAS